MKIYRKEIPYCAECPNCNWDLCMEKGKKVDINTIPSWCPLSDVVE